MVELGAHLAENTKITQTALREQYILLAEMVSFQSETFGILHSGLMSKRPDKDVILALFMEGFEMITSARLECEVAAYTPAMILLRCAYERLELARYFDKHPDRIASYLAEGKAPRAAVVREDLFGMEGTPDRDREDRTYKLLCDFVHSNRKGLMLRSRVSGEETFIVLFTFEERYARGIFSNILKFLHRLLVYELAIIQSEGIVVLKEFVEKWAALQDKLNAAQGTLIQTN